MTFINLLVTLFIGWLVYDTRRILKEATKEQDDAPKEP